jgi:hypothetical protein
MIDKSFAMPTVNVMLTSFAGGDGLKAARAIAAVDLAPF